METNWLYTYGTKTNKKDLEGVLCDENSQEVYFYGLRKKNFIP